MASLYLIPVTLGDTSIERVLPAYNIEVIRSLRHFIVEDIRSARRFLKRVDRTIDIDSLTFRELNKHSRPEEVAGYLAPLIAGESMGVISEAGCPAVADPGADVVGMAQSRGLKVVPLVGPSSILLSVMASGLGGQNFAFNGYLPIDSAERTKKIKQLEQRALGEGQTQVFIETPYRNNRLMQDLLHTLRTDTRLCVAADITCDDEYIRTLTVARWRSQAVPDLAKRPCIFVVGK